MSSVQGLIGVAMARSGGTRRLVIDLVRMWCVLLIMLIKNKVIDFISWKRENKPGRYSD